MNKPKKPLSTTLRVEPVQHADIKDDELSELLRLVYVNEGYTSPALAENLFEPRAVFARGSMFAAIDSSTTGLAGMIIVVPPDSTARVIAKPDECEMHLLGVKAEYRGAGLGRALVEAALEYATQRGWAKMILWTQASMTAAQSLYRSCGFKKTGRMKKNDIDFLIYEKSLSNQAEISRRRIIENRQE